MFFFNDEKPAEEFSKTLKESSEMATTETQAKAEGTGSITVALDGNTTITNLSLSNYQVDIAEGIGLVTYSIDGFFTVTNTMEVGMSTSNLISIIELV